MQTILDFLAVAPAVNAIVTAWLFGSLFDKPRSYFEARPTTFFGKLMTCPLCLPYHVAFWTLVCMWLPAQLLPAHWDMIPRVPLYAFAFTTLVHYMQGVLPIGEATEE